MKCWIEKICTNEKCINYKIDTGAEIDVMPLKVFKRFEHETELRQTSITLRAFGGATINPKGTCYLNCKFGNMSIKVKFAVVDVDVMPILGLRTCIRFGIVKPSYVRALLNQNNEL